MCTGIHECNITDIGIGIEFIIILSEQKRHLTEAYHHPMTSKEKTLILW